MTQGHPGPRLFTRSSLVLVCLLLPWLPSTLACLARPLEKPIQRIAVEVDRTYQQSPEKDIDLLFVIDNSNSMQAEQVNLARNFPRLIESLRSVKLGGEGCSEGHLERCRIPNVHIGVISSDMGAGSYGLPSCDRAGGDGGRLQNTPRRPGCPTPSDPWISYIDGATNIPGGAGDPVERIKETFACIAELGVGGCGYEHPLEAARRALDSTRGVNPGFLRPEALLAVVFLTDEDDCSAARPQLFDPARIGPADPLGPLTSFRCTEFGLECDQHGRQPGPRTGCRPGGEWLHRIDDYAAFFTGLKPKGRVLLFAIAGPEGPVEVGQEGSGPVLEPSCQSSSGAAVPAVRIKALLDTLGGEGQFNPGGVSICSGDFGPALGLIGERIWSEINQCLPAPPLTERGALACALGDRIGGEVTCARDCLDQAECHVEEIDPTGAASLLPRCPAAIEAGESPACGGSCPCWRILRDEQGCQRVGAPPYRLSIIRAGAEDPPRGTLARLRCAAALPGWGTPELAQLPQCEPVGR